MVLFDTGSGRGFGATGGFAANGSVSRSDTSLSTGTR